MELEALAPAGYHGVVLTTKQRTFRHFWHATMPVAKLADGPKPFRLMGEDIVLFLDRDGQPAALEDRCCHRTAKLSVGWCKGGNLVCGYHGWEYDRDGHVVAIPQLPGETVPRYQTPSYHAVERHGYVWVALEEPIAPIFDIPEANDPGFRRIDQFDEKWMTSPLRLMENSFDPAHFSFVHRGTFGNAAQPQPSLFEITETDFGFMAETIADVANPPQAHRISGETGPTTFRHMRNAWYLPFCRRLDIEYPSGRRHIIFTCATPIDDGSLQLLQFLYRNDTEADCSARELIDWDSQVIAEDRAILEAGDYDVPIDVSRRVEAHMPADRPGIIMRKRILELLRSRGEDEITNAKPRDGGRIAIAPLPVPEAVG
jgi:phenylpropionate dioxygenase-like ring-hydroxylating dioxygenase large terminal subunit